MNINQSEPVELAYLGSVARYPGDLHVSVTQYENNAPRCAVTICKQTGEVRFVLSLTPSQTEELAALLATARGCL